MQNLFTSFLNSPPLSLRERFGIPWIFQIFCCSFFTRLLLLSSKGTSQWNRENVSITDRFSLRIRLPCFSYLPSQSDGVHEFLKLDVALLCSWILRRIFWDLHFLKRTSKPGVWINRHSISNSVMKIFITYTFASVKCFFGNTFNFNAFRDLKKKKYKRPLNINQQASYTANFRHGLFQITRISLWKKIFVKKYVLSAIYLWEKGWWWCILLVSASAFSTYSQHKWRKWFRVQDSEEVSGCALFCQELIILLILITQELISSKTS